MKRVKHFARPLLPLLIGLGIAAVVLFGTVPYVATWLPWGAGMPQADAPAAPRPQPDAAGPVPPAAPPVAPQVDAAPRQDAAARPPEPRDAPRPPHPAPWRGWLWGWLLGTPRQWISIALIVGGLWLLGRQQSARPTQSIAATPSEPLHPETYQPQQEA